MVSPPTRGTISEMTNATPAEAAFLMSLSDRARGVFAFERAAGTPMAEDALRRLLRATRCPEWEVIFTLREQLGGLHVTTEAQGAEIRLFPTEAGWSPLGRPSGASGRALLVPIGFCTLHGRKIALVTDEHGVLHRDTGEPLATSILLLLEKLSLLVDVEPLPLTRLLAVLRPRAGAEVARNLGAAPVTEATDRYHAFWERDGALIADGNPFWERAEGDTFVWAKTTLDIARALAAVGRAAPEQAGADVMAADRLEESRPPREAPAAPTWGELRARGALPSLSQRPGRAGYVWGHREGDVTTVEQLRVWDGRVILVEQYQDAVCLAFDHANPLEALREVLSPRAARVFEELAPRRDWERTCSREELTRRLEEKGLPVFEAALDFESCFGGLHVAHHVFGVFASLDDFAGPGLVMVGREGHHNRFAMDEAGLIYFIDREVHEAPIAVSASWKTWFERFQWARSCPPGSASFRVAGPAGGPIAEALLAPPAPEASDRFATLWFREGVAVHEMLNDPFEDGAAVTSVVAASLDDAVAALEVCRRRFPTAPLLWTSELPRRAGRDTGEPALRVPLDDRTGRGPRELWVHGKPGAFWVEAVDVGR
jgi:hypothetical protein